jgi:hypothetical protein
MAKNNKRRNKKYDPLKAAGRVSEYLLKRHAIAYLVSLDRCVLVDCKAMQPVQPSATVARAITDIPHEWAINCSVLCRDQLGKEYLVTQQVACKGRYYHSDLIDVLNQYHKDLVKTCNKLHVINYGWLATLNDEEIDPAEQEQIYRMLDGFECYTKREAIAEGIIEE